VPADHPKWRVEPLRWAIPGGRGQLVHWNVAEGQSFAGGTVLAQVRTPDERVFDVAAAHDGVLLAQHPLVGNNVGPTLLVRTKRPASPLAGDPPDKRQELSGSGEWFLTPERHLLVECVPGAAQVRLLSIPDGHVVSSFEPDWDGAPPQRGRVFVSPTGQLSLVAWDQTGLFSIFDVLSGDRVVTFRDGNTPQQVAVNEAQWRLTVAGEDSGSAGRYRRSVATVWDLTTGRKLEKLANDQPLPGYVDRSARDGFGTRAVSPDGRMCAVAVRGSDGPAALALQEITTDAEVFRAEHGDSRRVRTAFSADGQFLLANWDCDRHSEVDVWEL
jgi:WD40 repeat protein